MIQKIIDSLNWLYIGIAGIIFAVISWLGIMAASAFTKKTASLHWNDHLNVVSTQAAEKTIIKIEDRLTDFLQEIKESNFNLFEIQKDNIRKEVKEVFDPIKHDIIQVKNDIAFLKKDNELKDKQISSLSKDLNDYRESHHGTIAMIQGVLNSTMDILKEYHDKLFTNKKTRTHKMLKTESITNGHYYE